MKATPKPPMPSPVLPLTRPPSHEPGRPTLPAYERVFAPAPRMPWLDRVAVVLVRPQGPANVGMIARAMRNFGLTRLRVVAPAPPLTDREARDHACHAVDVLEGATVYGDVASALADRSLVLGTSIPRGGTADRHELDTPRTAAGRIRAAAAAGNGVALVFGPENHGLTNDDLAPCHRVITIPAHPDYPILNLAQCVMLIAYEIFLTEAPQPLPPVWAARPELDRVDADLAQTLIDVGFATPAGVHRALKPLRRLFSRAGLTPRDVRLIHGVLSSIRHMAGKRRPQGPTPRESL